VEDTKEQLELSSRRQRGHMKDKHKKGSNRVFDAPKERVQDLVEAGVCL
jgi:hypothetical protein